MTPDNDTNFGSSQHDITVCLTAGARRIIEAQALASGTRETGGILIGHYERDGRMATVTEATMRPKDSRSGRIWFQRGVQGLGDILRLRWNNGNYYIGEWHSHPGGTPEPSRNDIREMQAISREISYQCPKPIMIIVGTSDGPNVKLSASVMAGGILIVLADV